MRGLCGATEYNYYTNTGFLLGVALSAPSAGSGCQACSVNGVFFLHLTLLVFWVAIFFGTRQRFLSIFKGIWDGTKFDY